MSKQKKPVVLSEEAERIVKALGGATGLVKLHARELENHRGGLSLVIGDDSRGAPTFVAVRPEGSRYILTIKSGANGGRVREFSIPLEQLSVVLWDQLVEAASS